MTQFKTKRIMGIGDKFVIAKTRNGGTSYHAFMVMGVMPTRLGSQHTYLIIPMVNT